MPSDKESRPDLDIWLQPQSFRQESPMGCGLCVFAKLANLSEEEILSDMPDAVNGKTLDQWEEYLKGKDWEMTRFQAGESYGLPCAHVCQIIPGDYHWIYQAQDEGIHDPNPACQHYPPRLMKLSFYKVILTVTLKRRSGSCAR